jgi:hypothetical protein
MATARNFLKNPMKESRPRVGFFVGDCTPVKRKATHHPEDEFANL